MNDRRNLMFRLLRSFPVSVLKENFETENKVQNLMISEIVEIYPEQVIIDFCILHLNFTKQHVFIFNNTLRYNDLINHRFLSENRIDVNNNGEEQIESFLVEQTYNLVVSSVRNDGISRMNLVFLQPIQIITRTTALIIKMTILERNPNTYLEDYEVIKYKREIEDDDVLERFKTHLQREFDQEFYPMDINRGIKHLWENDSIDALYVKYKRERSIATEVMDEDYTFKQQDPVRYAEVMASPLRKHAFRFLNSQEDFCDFVTNPSEGTLSFHKYPANNNQITNVISEVLRNN